MKTSVKHLSDTKVLITLTIDSDELKDAELVAAKALAKDLKIAGFRKGKVPIKVALKHLDEQTLANHTLEVAVNKAIALAFDKHSLQPLANPDVQLKKYVPHQSAEVTAEAEIFPKVSLGKYDKLKPLKLADKITTDEIDTVIDTICSQMAEKKEVVRAAKLGDEVVIDFVGRVDGEAFEGGTATGHTLTLGSGSFIPGFEDGVVGHKVGKTFDVKVDFPADYHAEHLKAKPAVFETTIAAIREVVPAELSDELAAKVGPFTSKDELIEDIKRELTARKERENHEKIREDLIRQLIDKSTVPIPEVLKQAQMRSVEQDMTQNVTYSGKSIDDYLKSQGYDTKEAWLTKEVEPAAELRIKAGMVLAELSRELQISVSDEEVTTRVDMLRQQYANNPDMAKQLDEPQVQREIANRILTDKTIDHLVELNTKQ